MTKERARLLRRYTQLNDDCLCIEHMRDTGQIKPDCWDFWRTTYRVKCFWRTLAHRRLQRLGVSEQQINAGYPQQGQIPLPIFKENRDEHHKKMA
jgi:hypothetical protein